MARRNDHSRDEIRAMALSAAEALLDREGVAGLSTRKIAAEIGYTVGSLYLVFDNLDDLILQVNARTLAALAEWLDRAALAQPDAAAGVRALGRTYVRYADRHRSRWELIFNRQRASDAVLPDWYLQSVAGLFERVERQLADYAPQRTAADRSLAARVLWSGVHGVCTLALSDRLDIAGIAEAERLTDSLIENYLAGWVNNSGEWQMVREDT
jgi:AcrR family transcriptional regulator